MIDLSRISYCRVGTPDLDLAATFGTRMLGLEVEERTRTRLYLKSDDRHHTLCYHLGDAAEQAVAFEVERGQLERAGAHLDAIEHPFRSAPADEREDRRVRDAIFFADPAGNPIELVERPLASSRRYHGARDAGITGFSHVGLFTDDPVRDELFWTRVMNARVSDRIGDAPLLRIDAMHHTIALLPRAVPGIHHISHQVASTDDVQRSFNLLRGNTVPIAFGPGRHPASSAQFLYFSGPDGLTFEYSAGVMEIADEPIYRERQLAFPSMASANGAPYQRRRSRRYERYSFPGGTLGGPTRCPRNGAGGVGNGFGHCSRRLDDAHFLVNPAKPPGLALPGENGAIVALDGPLPDGVLGEVRIHREIYRRRPDVGGICRFASPKLLSLSALGRSPRVLYGFGAYFAPAAPFWDDVQLLRDDAMAAALAKGLGDERAIVMRGNGAVVAADTLPQALALAVFLEDAARVDVDLLAASADQRIYSDGEARQRATFQGRVVERLWDYLTAGDPEAVNGSPA